MQNNWFTLIELMVWISIIWIVSFWIFNLYWNQTSDKQKLNIFTNKIIWKIDTAKNYSLVWKWIWINLDTPKYFKVEFSTWNYLKTYYNTWTTDNIFNELSILNFENFYELKSIKCKNIDLSNISETNLVSVSYEWTNITLSWCTDSYQKVVDLELFYKWFSNTLRLNAVSWVLQKLR